MSIVVRLVVLVLAVGCLPTEAFAAKWTKLRTAHFVFIGDASEYEIKRTAQKLEHFRTVMGMVIPGVATASSDPITVLVFAGDQSFSPYKPRFRGRRTEVAGYFQSGEDMNYIAVTASSDDDSFRTIFHEYVHFLTSAIGVRLPVWASEGLAEVYETFEARNDGAIIGLASAEHVAYLQTVSTLVPLSELMAVTHDSPIYNEGDRRGVLYAQSWALMHYLMLGDPARQAQLLDYLSRLHAGASSLDAFKATFGADPAALERGLRDYVRRLTFRAMRLKFDEKATGSNAVSKLRGTTIEASEAEGYLNDLLARIGGADEAKTRLTALVQKDPGNARAGIALALIETRGGRQAEAVPLALRASAAAPTDASIQIATARVLMERLRTLPPSDAARVETLRDARAVLITAAALQPGRAETHAMRGYVELVTGTDMPSAVIALKAAVTLAPANESARMNLAQALARQRDFDGATAILGTLVAAGSTPEIRSSARDMLGRVAQMRQPRPSPVVTASTAEASSLLPLPPIGGTGVPAGGGIRARLDLRPVLTGETRVFGALRSIDCAAGGVTLKVDTEGRTLRLTTTALTQVEFVTFRDAEEGRVACGPVPNGERIYATYRTLSQPKPGSDGTAVAIELLPDWFRP